MYAWSEISDVWLREGQVSLAPAQLVECFNVCEEILGRDWIEAIRANDCSNGWGPLPTLSIAGVGARLNPVRSAKGFDKLAARLKTNQRSAFAEMTAAYLCVSGRNDVQLEFEVPVSVGDGIKVPDFRVMRPGENWTYVEVAAPETSDPNKHAAAVIAALADRLCALPSESTIEILLLRVPLEHESQLIADHALDLAEQGAQTEDEIADLAEFSINREEPCRIEHRDNKRALGPVRVIAKTFTTASKPDKHVVVRVPITDLRAEDVLAGEARQLPKSAAGLIMLDLNSVAGAIRDWPALLVRRLQPNINTRVGAICLFGGSSLHTPEGEGIVPETKVLINPHAAIAAPSWLTTQLQEQSGVPFGM